MPRSERLTRVVAFGDSITRGYGVADGDGWVERMSALLKGKEGDTVAVFNAGENGNTSAEGLGRFDRDVLPRLPALVLVEFGGNDAVHEKGRHVSIEEFERNMIDICNRVRAAGGRVVLLTFPPVVNEWHSFGRHPFYAEAGGLDQYVEAYRRRTRDIAARLGCPLFDLDARIRELMENEGAEKFIMKDGVHLTREAHERVASMLLPCLMQALGR